MILQWIAIAYLLYRVHILGAAIAMRPALAQVMRPVNDTQLKRLEDFFQKQWSTTTSVPSFDYKPQVSAEYHVLDFSILFMLIVITLYLISQSVVRQRRRNNMYVFAHIVGRHEHVMVPILKLPHRSNLYRFTADRFVERISIEGIIFPQIRIRWPSFMIQHTVLTRTTRLPTACRISFLQAMRLRNILTSEFELLMFIQDGNAQNFKLMPLEGTDWSRIPSTSLEDVEIWRTGPNTLEQPPQYV